MGAEIDGEMERIMTLTTLSSDSDVKNGDKNEVRETVTGKDRLCVEGAHSLART